MKRIIQITLITIQLLIVQNAFGQVKGLSPFEPEKLIQNESLQKIGSDKLLQGESFPIGNIVSAEHYYVGPGDVLSLQSINEGSDQQLIYVTPENSILIPRIGEISLKGKTLAETRKMILDKIKEKNNKAVAYITLYIPRMVLITINGNLQHPGSFTMPASYRVSTAINSAIRAQTQLQVSQQQSIENYRIQEKRNEIEKLYSESGFSPTSSYAQRNITLTHNDGSSQVVDLLKALATSDYEFDPFIREGDAIYIPYEKCEYPKISLTGAVLEPCNIPFKQNDKASLLLKFGHGFSETADTNNIYLSMPDGQSTHKLLVDYKMNILGEDYLLMPGSSIIVGQKPVQAASKIGVVSIKGNVKRPSVYSIVLNQTRLKDVIEMAGGFTEDAYLPLAYILRGRLMDFSAYNPMKDIREGFQYSDLTLEDTIRFQINTNYKRPLVSCDFVAAFEKNSERDNVPIMDGDMIVVPSNPKSVFLSGQVNQPGYLTLTKGMNYEWYINQAGGYAVGADKKRTRILKGKNKVWLEAKDKVEIEAGDEIYVPHPPDLPPGVEMQTYGIIASAIASAATLINVIIFIFR